METTNVFGSDDERERKMIYDDCVAHIINTLVEKGFVVRNPVNGVTLFTSKGMKLLGMMPKATKNTSLSVLDVILFVIMILEIVSIVIGFLLLPQ